MMQSNKKINNKHTLFLYYFMSDRVVVYLLHIRAIKSKWPKSPSTVYWPDLIQVIDVHHGNYNPSCKAKTNVQEDSDGPMTRARAKQLQRALTSQIGMIEAASELKISNQFEIDSGMFICLQLELGDEKSP